ncbi:MAG: DNA-binding protein WhiA [Clostridia bacterium]|nr:DNA-binding protein WhiA [Clostridia bacterium]
MSFSSDVRNELAHDICTQSCCARAELCAAILANGSITYRGKDRYALTLTSIDGSVVRRYFGLLKQFYGITGQIRTIFTETLSGMTRYLLTVDEESATVLLDKLGLRDSSALFGIRQLPDDDTISYTCCQKSYLRGAYLMCGRISTPSREYNLEFEFSDEDFAIHLTNLIKKFEISCKYLCRKSKYVVYCKRADDIVSLLTLMGAGKAVLKLEDIRIQKSVLNQVNRMMNCEDSNINRTVEAAGSQQEDILYLDREVGLDKLPRSLREIAMLRIANPETSLSGLGALLNPPLGKSGVNARLRRISAMAEKLRCGEDIGL